MKKPLLVLLVLFLAVPAFAESIDNQVENTMVSNMSGGNVTFNSNSPDYYKVKTFIPTQIPVDVLQMPGLNSPPYEDINLGEIMPPYYTAEELYTPAEIEDFLEKYPNTVMQTSGRKVFDNRAKGRILTRLPNREYNFSGKEVQLTGVYRGQRRTVIEVALSKAYHEAHPYNVYIKAVRFWRKDGVSGGIGSGNTGSGIGNDVAGAAGVGLHKNRAAEEYSYYYEVEVVPYGDLPPEAFKDEDRTSGFRNLLVSFSVNGLTPGDRLTLSDNIKALRAALVNPSGDNFKVLIGAVVLPGKSLDKAGVITARIAGAVKDALGNQALPIETAVVEAKRADSIKMLEDNMADAAIVFQLRPEEGGAR